MDAVRKHALEAGMPGAATPPDPWVTLLHASRLLKRHRQTVQTWMLEGRIRWDRRAGMTFAMREDVLRVAAELGIEIPPSEIRSSEAE